MNKQGVKVFNKKELPCWKLFLLLVSAAYAALFVVGAAASSFYTADFSFAETVAETNGHNS